jgi:hypothetical protein
LASGAAARRLADTEGVAHRLLERARWFDAPPSSPALSGDLDQRPLINKTTLPA